MRLRGNPSRVLLGAGLACIASLLTWSLAGLLRSPYVIAFAAVILSAWLWDMAAAVATGVVCSLLIEFLIFGTHKGNPSPSYAVEVVRSACFLAFSLGVAAFTRRMANERARQQQLATEWKHALLQAEQSRSLEQQQLRDLARENEVRVELALEGADLGVWEWNLEANLSRWSPGFYRIHLLQDEQAPGYEVWRSLVHHDDLANVEREIERAIATREPFTCEYRLSDRAPAEADRWIALGGKTVQSVETKPVVVAGYCLDITRRKHTEAALLQTEKLALAGRLAASIAHEINNPLEAAVNLVYLSKTATDEERAAYLDEAIHQLNRVATIAKQTLRFARRSDGPAKCAPAATVDAVLTLLRPKMEWINTQLVREIRTDRELLCSPGELQQIITNIVNNAVDAMANGGTLRIRISNAARWNDAVVVRGVRVTISDSGTGMPKEVFRRMKEPFFTTKQETGTGLGMWVAYELVERNGGHLSARTRTADPCRGTIFSLFLPSEAAASAHPEPSADFLDEETGFPIEA